MISISQLTHTGNEIMKNQGMTLVSYTYSRSLKGWIFAVSARESWNKIMQPLTQAPRERSVKDKLKYVSIVFMTKPHRAKSLCQIILGFSFKSQAGEIKRKSISGFSDCISFPSVKCLEGKRCCPGNHRGKYFSLFYFSIPTLFTIVTQKGLTLDLS